MKYIIIEDWNQFRNLLTSNKSKVIHYKIDNENRKLILQIFLNSIVYIYRSKPDSIPYRCGIFEEIDEEVKKLTKPIAVTNEIIGKRITYLVGAQKIRGFNMWCVYSDFGRTVKEELFNEFSDFILIEGSIKEA
jgi:hypothetical protein